MSVQSRRYLGLGFALIVAALAQMLTADAMQIHRARPEFLLLTLVIGSMFCDANQAAGLGFAAGLLQASIASPPHAGFGSLIVSRTLVGFSVGWLEKRIFRDNPLMAVALAAGGTALAQILFFLLSPQPPISRWALIAGYTTLYNTLLALPCYLFIRRLVGRQREEQS